MRVLVTDVISSVGHPRLDLVGLLMMDNSIHIRGTNVVLHVPRDSINPSGNGLKSWVDHMVLCYDLILLLHHVLYLDSMYDDIVRG
jgi:hypothetical protein